ncbi:MAG: ATP-dependent zinc protease family protein [Chromatiales bacterium]
MVASPSCGNREERSRGVFNQSDGLLRVGWREWVGLPLLNMRALKAKVDTGARTSALHAFSLERYTESGTPRARFYIHPRQNRTDIAVTCEADIVDERWVTDSGGHKERRIVIMTDIVLGDLRYPIELTITDRDTMRFRMLLGRGAIRGRLLVDTSVSYLLGKPKLPARGAG